MSDQPGSRQHLREVSALFLRLGVFAFGGPAAHIAMMRDEVVRRRRWLSDQEFLDTVGATNLIPGPNSTEMAIHIGYLRAGWPGLASAGAFFILPAALMVGGLAWAYVEYGTTPGVIWLLYGIKPVVIAIVASALWGLGRTALKGPATAAVGAVVIVLFLLGVNELSLLFGGGAVVVAARSLRRLRGASIAGLLAMPIALPLASAAAAVTAPFSMSTLFLSFLKIGAVLYGSGYVLLAFVRADFVERLGWLTDRQLIDAVAIGQVTPGPVFTTATFIGYITGGWPGALLATVAIFLPSFAFVALLGKIVPLARRNQWAGAALDGVNAASLGLMAAVSYQLGKAAVVDVATGVIAGVSLAVLLKLRLNSVWLIAGGAVAGVAYQAVRL